MASNLGGRLWWRKGRRIPPEELGQLISPDMERSMYLHPNPLAREIFWQRIDEIARLVDTIPGVENMRCLDLGGGTGVLAFSAAGRFSDYVIVDLEAEDARRVCRRYSLPNVTVIEEDIFVHEPDRSYDVVVAADVLEHFEDLGRIVARVGELVRPGGRLIVSLPTENLLYRVGRVILRKTKPADHFHDSRSVLAMLEAIGFRTERASWIPRLVAPLPLFDVVLLEAQP